MVAFIGLQYHIGGLTRFNLMDETLLQFGTDNTRNLRCEQKKLCHIQGADPVAGSGGTSHNAAIVGCAHDPMLHLELSNLKPHGRRFDGRLCGFDFPLQQ